MRHVLIVGGTPTDRARAVRRRVPHTHTALIVDAGTLPFVRVRDLDWPPPPRVVIIEEIERASPDSQSGGTRIVLTQSTYLLQTLIDRLDEHDLIVATADRAALERRAPEAFQERGPWHDFGLVNTEDAKDTKEENALVSSVSFVLNSPVPKLLERAFAASDPGERLRLCREAVALAPESAVASLALASAYRETRDGTAARDALDRAAGLAPEWEAIAYESGKLWLVYDDMAQARDAFEQAVDLMPTFSAACSNLGATLGELGEPRRALEAFRQALAHDPRSFTILNNIGVVCRELGRFDESEAALRRVIEINPAFVFGHYNLGHTLFLAGRHRESLDAYQEGQRRDPQRNRRQGCRLAVLRLANGDAAGAERDLWTFANAAPADEREDLLLEAYEVAHALLAQNPALEPHRPFLDRIGAEIAKSE
jgi:tetratricopeptide (TPR) repeat protein